MASHSPGPWIAALNCPTAAIPGHIIRTGDSVARPIASLWVGGGTEGKPTQVANALLIAAAPDLLRVAKALLMFYRPSFEPEAWQALTGSEEATTKVLGDLARAAIAKAKGA